MDGHTYEIQWVQQSQPRNSRINSDTNSNSRLDVTGGHRRTSDDIINEQDVDVEGHDYLIGDEDDDPTESDIDQAAAENLIFMAQDGQVITEIITAAEGGNTNGAIVVSGPVDGNGDIDCSVIMQHLEEMNRQEEDQQHQETGLGDDEANVVYSHDFSQTSPQMVTEEVITDDWVQHQGEERVEIPAEQILGASSSLDVEVPLPTVQDEYTALRPYPCDFCSRRFRKKSTLMNHIVAHQHDRPHLCKLCGSRYFRRSDLINHFKAHAEEPDANFSNEEPAIFEEYEEPKPRNGVDDHYYDQVWQMQNDHSSVYDRMMRKQRSNGNSESEKPRGRVSRLKLKEENYTIDESVPPDGMYYQDYQQQLPVTSSTSATSPGSVKIDRDDQHSSGEYEKEPSYPVIDNSKPFVCQQCGLAFARQKALQSHAKTHQNDLPYECTQCNEIFWDLASLEEHQRVHSFEESNSEYDPDDGVDESQSESESDRAYGEFYCSECGLSFHRQNLLKRHAKTHLKPVQAGGQDLLGSDDKEQQLHCCNTCGESFAEALDLLAHAEIHARYPPFKCVLCGVLFYEEEKIKRHLQVLHHNELTPNSCILCGKACRDRKALIKHAWDHSREKCHSCSKCGKSFHNKARLKRHMASHRDKSVTCDVCHEEFPDGRTLSNHRHSHSTTSGKLFPCHECGKTFGSRSSQQIHVRIHTGERPYGCRYCWKAFADGGTLRKHERIHTGEKPYACSVCPRAFNQRVVLREHIRSHHSGVDGKRGTFHCTVCSADLPSSNELIKHLIQHSDVNTAKQRQPITGPRKYKRRRKLKPHEIARLHSERQNQNGNVSDIDLSEFDIDNVDELLGITESEAAAPTSGRAKAAAAKRLNNNKNTHTNGRKVRRDTSGGASNEAFEEEEENDNNEEATEESTSAETKKKRFNSSSSPSEKLWQTKLVQAAASDDTYKSLFSNVENTLQSIDSLVVESGGESGAQRTHQVQYMKPETKTATEGSNRTRRKPEKAQKAAPAVTAGRPRMIHTEKVSAMPPMDGGSGRTRRGKANIIRTQTARIELLPAPGGHHSNAQLVDDYEIMSPDAKPPKQISSSPQHIKQEHHQNIIVNHNNNHSSHHSLASRADLYDAHLLLEATTLRKDSYEKFNPSIVNDLEEILRSPLKSDKSGRHRFTSECSTQSLTDQAEAEQHLIKIEPTSPDLREIVASSVTPSNTSALTPDEPSSGSERRPLRSTRNRAINRKYLEFDTDLLSLGHSSSSTTKQRRNNNHPGQTGSSRTSRTARNSAQQQQKTSPSTPTKSAQYLNYDYEVVTATTTVSSCNATTASTVSAPASGSASASVSAETSATSSQQQPPERKQPPQRFFECEMCSAVFPDRAQLLVHVPIHI